MTAPLRPQVTKNEARNQATMSIAFFSEFEFFLMILVALHNGPRLTIVHNQDTLHIFCKQGLRLVVSD